VTKIVESEIEETKKEESYKATSTDQGEEDMVNLATPKVERESSHPA